jgi:prevent-host-death family protein
MAYTVHQAKTNFSRLLREVEAGQEVVVMRGKKPVAKLVPANLATQTRRIPGGFEGLASAPNSAFDPLSDQELADLGFESLLPAISANPAKL